MDKETRLNVLKKWKSCKTKYCSINITDSYRKFIECLLCKQYSKDGSKIRNKNRSYD